MEQKVCSRCNQEKSLEEFYTGSGYRDGYQRRCKKCVGEVAREREKALMELPGGMEALRARHREKYKRLNYKERQLKWDSSKPWKKTSVYKNLARKYKYPKGMEIHHWNYNDEYLEDFIVLTTEMHHTAHKTLVLDVEKRVFIAFTGELLDTKEKHINYLLSRGVLI